MKYESYQTTKKKKQTTERKRGIIPKRQQQNMQKVSSNKLCVVGDVQCIKYDDTCEF